MKAIFSFLCLFIFFISAKSQKADQDFYSSKNIDTTAKARKNVNVYDPSVSKLKMPQPVSKNTLKPEKEDKPALPTTAVDVVAVKRLAQKPDLKN